MLEDIWGILPRTCLLSHQQIYFPHILAHIIDYLLQHRCRWGKPSCRYCFHRSQRYFLIMGRFKHILGYYCQQNIHQDKTQHIAKYHYQHSPTALAGIARHNDSYGFRHMCLQGIIQHTTCLNYRQMFPQDSRVCISFSLNQQSNWDIQGICPHKS